VEGGRIGGGSRFRDVVVGIVGVVVRAEKRFKLKVRIKLRYSLSTGCGKIGERV